MTSTSLADATDLRPVPTEPDPLGDGTSRRRRSRFPERPLPRVAGPPTRGSAVLWRGRSEGLREQLADHTAAVGLALVDADAASGGATGVGAACAVVTEAGVALGSPLARDAPPLLVLTEDEEIAPEVWRVALAEQARAVLRLPRDSESLLAHLAELSRPRGSALLLGVAGGCGGAGASSLAARLAAAARADGPVVLIDADPLGGGLDLLVEAPPISGITWQEATRLGPDDGEALRTGLPLVDDVRLLVAGEDGGPGAEALRRALSSLAPLAGTVVVDLAPSLVRPALELLDRLVLVVPGREGAVRAAERRLRDWAPAAGRAGAVVRRDRGPSAREVAADLGLPLLGAFRDGSRGDVPLLDVRRGGADRTARELVSRLREEARR